jgi:hypothetical protein
MEMWSWRALIKIEEAFISYTFATQFDDDGPLRRNDMQCKGKKNDL